MAVNQLLKTAINQIKFNENLTQADIASKIGVKSTYLSDMINGRVPLSDNISEKIYELFHIKIHSSDTTLMDTIIKQSESTSELDEKDALKLYYEMSATASNIEDLLDNEITQPYRLLNFPQFRGYVAMFAYGDSMLPTIKNGDIIVFKHQPAEFIENGSIYLIVTRDGQRMIKRLVQNRRTEEGKIIYDCISDNPNQTIYKPFELDGDMVTFCTKIVGSISCNEY